MIHELKIEQRFYEDIANGIKKFELRKDDRDFKIGDTLCLREYQNSAYSGRMIFKKIEYILRDGGDYGLRKGFCILGIY